MIPLSSKENATAPNAQFPYGQIKDDDGTGNGVPVNREVYQDLHTFFEKIMDVSNITPNGILDDAYNGYQLYLALLALNGGHLVKEVNIGFWNMDSTLSVSIDLAALGIDVTKVKGVSVVIHKDADIISGAILKTDLLIGGYWLYNDQDQRIDLFRTTSGTYDDTGYNDPAVNRGTVIIRYTP